MKLIFILIALLFSLSSLADKVFVGQFVVDTESGLIVDRTELSILVTDSASGALLKLSPFRMPESATFEDVVKENERGGYLSIGEFKLSSSSKKFNLYEGTWERSWLAYSRDYVFLIKNESRKEKFPELEILVKKMLSATSWAKP
ncbi:hypothetical protein [Teredinibacter turnerae]|uniref:hypothetical protein n=1 Tax=Teredinibacter turnerae TaxID=2426 RepID=UPI00048BF371|nr:hypothetical protein [Teredinibacter turnerae]